MSNIYEDFKDIIKQNPNLDAVSIFFNRMPDEKDEVISIFSTTGLINLKQIDVIYPGFCIKIRSKVPERAYFLSKELFNLLYADGLKSLTSSNGRKMIFKNINYPSFLQSDSKERDVYVMNIIILTEMEG